MRTTLLLGLIPFAGLTIVLLIRALPGDQTGRDFRQLYAAGFMVRTGQASQLYNMEIQQSVQQRVVSGGSGGYIPFIRPAYEAIFLMPLSLLPYRTAYFCFLGLNVLLLGVTITMLSSGSVWGVVQVSSMVLCFMPVSITLFAGQDSVLLAVILAASCKALDRQRPLVAGVIAGLALFKFQLMIPIFLLFLLWKRWRFCYGFALSALVLGLVSISVTGVHQLGSYIQLLQEVDRSKTLGVPLMANLRGLLVGTMGGISEKAVIAADVGLGVLLAIFLLRLQERRNALLLAIPAAVLCCYYLFSHDLTPLFLPIVAVMTARQPTSLAWWSALLLLLAPTALMTHSSWVALPLGFFLLEFAIQGRPAKRE
ncbi:MAG: glycosyltransferase family 87 protein [Terriglobales bacterium]|jgi:hypothetical protein